MDPFLGEIRSVGFSFAPVNWAFCAGQILSIAQNTALFSLIGTTYGGDGVNTFSLPDLRSRIALHQGSSSQLGNVDIGQIGGAESVTLTASQAPSHSHLLGAAATALSAVPGPAVVLGTPAATIPIYAGAGTTTLTPGSLSLSGGNQPHENRQPFLAINYIIALAGIFPSRS